MRASQALGQCVQTGQEVGGIGGLREPGWSEREPSLQAKVALEHLNLRKCIGVNFRLYARAACPPSRRCS